MTVRTTSTSSDVAVLDLIPRQGKDRPVAVYESLGYRAHEPGLAALLDPRDRSIAAYRLSVGRTRV